MYVMKGQLPNKSTVKQTMKGICASRFAEQNASETQEDDFGWHVQNDRMRGFEIPKGNRKATELQGSCHCGVPPSPVIPDQRCLCRWERYSFTIQIPEL